MQNLAGTVATTLARRLKASSELGDDDCHALAELPWTIENYRSRADIVVEGQKPTHCCLVLSGFTIRHHLMKDGARQIQAINVVGDIPDLHSLFIKKMDHTFGTLSSCTLAFIPHNELCRICFERPAIGSALWRETLIDASTFRASITRVAQLSARERIAHLFCEMEIRLSTVGLAANGKFQLPTTQEELGEFLGLSAVQINRSLRDLRTDGLLSINRHEVEILDRDRLRTAADFDPIYLHLAGDD